MSLTASGNTRVNASSNSSEVCRYFLKGTCRFGNNCFYSHDVTNPTERPQIVCRNYIAGYCSFGDNCIFAHSQPEESTKKKDSVSACSSKTGKSTSASASSSTSTTLSEKSAKNSDEHDKTKKSTNISYYEALTGESCPSTHSHHSNDNDINMFDAGYPTTSPTSRIPDLCPYYEKSMTCPYGDECVFAHGDLCDICNMPCLHPFDEEQRTKHQSECMKQVEKEMEEAFAYQRSSQKVCGICMEVVWDKENTKPCDRRFGILENCNHVFCLPCIRKWRSSKSYENKIVKACPECRVKSDYVTPSRYWFENEENKLKIINDYKSNLSQTPCKYFKQGDGTCPFGNKCFYLHRYKDGRLADLPEPTKRRRLNKFGALEMFASSIQLDFDASDDDFDTDDDYDSDDNERALQFFRALRRTLRDGADSDDSNLSLFELPDEVISLYDFGASF